MIGDVFDSPWKILIIAVLIIVLFGSRKLPEAARSLGRSMRILKAEVQSMHDDEPTGPVQASAAQAMPVQAQVSQAQIDSLQEQISSLQQSVSTNGSVPADV